MEIIINSKNINLGEEHKKLIEKKLNRIGRHFADDATANVTLCEEKTGLVKFDLTVHSGANTFRADESNSDIRFCMDRVVDKIKNQNAKTKDRRKSEKPVLIEEPI